MTIIQEGDTVRCLVGYYKSYAFGEKATVKRLDSSSSGNPVIILKNDLCDYGESMYSLDNWEFVTRPTKKKEPPMATEKTKYFGIKLRETNTPSEFLPIDDNYVTKMFDSGREVEEVVEKHVANGESWIIVQTKMLMEPEVPLPPIKRTYFK